MAKFLAQKHFGALRPADEQGEAALRKLKHGATVTIEMRRTRNPRFHRMFWALMTIVWEQQETERYPTVEDLVAAVKIAAGLRTRIELPNGDVGFIPGSIAFHKMDEQAFSEFYDRVCDLLAKYFIPGVTSEQLRAEVETMIGMRSAA